MPNLHKMNDRLSGLYALYYWEDIISYGKKLIPGIYVINAPPPKGAFIKYRGVNGEGRITQNSILRGGVY